jgi:hypothetical protein
MAATLSEPILFIQAVLRLAGRGKSPDSFLQLPRDRVVQCLNIQGEIDYEEKVQRDRNRPCGARFRIRSKLKRG